MVLNRLRTSIDDHFFRPDGNYEVLGGRQTLRSFIVEWREPCALHRARENGERMANILGIVVFGSPARLVISVGCSSFGVDSSRHQTSMHLTIEICLRSTSSQRRLLHSIERARMAEPAVSTTRH